MRGLGSSPPVGKGADAVVSRGGAVMSRDGAVMSICVQRGSVVAHAIEAVIGRHRVVA